MVVVAGDHGHPALAHGHTLHTLLLPHLETPLLAHIAREVVVGDLLGRGKSQHLGAEGGQGAVFGGGL